MVGLTVGDEQQHEGFVPAQVADGPLVGVVLRGGVWQDGLGLTGRDGRTVPDHCRTTDAQLTEPQTRRRRVAHLPMAASRNRAVETTAVP